MAADTFSSELGILSSTHPILLTDFSSLLLFRPRRVPPGTNGGVTTAGLLAGVAGAGLMAVFGVMGIPYCTPSSASQGNAWTLKERLALGLSITACGALGSVFDSLLGGLLQASVVDSRTRKIVEGEGGTKVKYSPSKSSFSKGKEKGTEGSSGRVVLSGRDILSNNGVNFAMASGMSLAGMAAAGWCLGVGL